MLPWHASDRCAANMSALVARSRSGGVLRFSGSTDLADVQACSSASFTYTH